MFFKFRRALREHISEAALLPLRGQHNPLLASGAQAPFPLFRRLLNLVCLKVPSLRPEPRAELHPKTEPASSKHTLLKQDMRASRILTRRALEAAKVGVAQWVAGSGF